MTTVDITADLNDEDETGFVWTFLHEATRPGGDRTRSDRDRGGTRVSSGRRGHRSCREAGRDPSSTFGFLRER